MSFLRTWASVVRLLLCCGPLAIGRFVMAFIVNAVKRVARGWSFAHVIEEGLERLTPRWADSNSSAAVANIGRQAWIFATLNHVLPSVVFRNAIHAMRAMRDHVPFASVASTRCGRASTEQRAGDRLFDAAIAAADPFRRVRFRDSRQSHEASKPLIGQVNNGWCHMRHSTLFGV